MSNIHITLHLDFSPQNLKKYFGFTEEEIDHLAAKEPKMIDFEKLQMKSKQRSRK
jgi:hypothetical protein